MTPSKLDYSARVVYIRDAKIFPCLDNEKMELREAVEAAITNHRTGEYPCIIGTGLQLIGIDAIRAARARKIDRDD
jgi:hypothetical protein